MSFKRYEKIKVRQNANKKRIYNTSMYPKIPKSENDIYIYAVRGDRLDLLADDYYGDVTLWFVIAHANSVGRGTMYIEAGKQIRIPEEESVTKFLSNIETTNSVR